MPQPKKPRKPKGPEPLVLNVNGEEFALSAVHTLEDGQKLQLPSFDWVDQLSFREQIEVRRIARELSGNDSGEFSDFAPMDVAPALLAVVGKRTDETFTLDDALDFDWGKATARPPKQAASQS